MPSEKDHSRFSDIHALVNDVNLHGYYGGIRLLKATIKRFYDYCNRNQIELHNRNFTIRYSSDIPHGVGLAGSSAIITACLRALMAFYGVNIPKFIQANLILSAETDELHITAGLQDRVVQVYQGLVYMDFDKKLMQSRGYGKYDHMDINLLPNLYMAYKAELGEPTEIFHNNIRDRFDNGEKAVVDAMRYWASLANKFRKCLENDQPEKAGMLIDANFNRRTKLYKMSSDNMLMVKTARSTGASAKFTGSGGAIVGAYKNQKDFNALKSKLGKIGVIVIKPKIIGTKKYGLI
jgi:glucuronokinase